MTQTNKIPVTILTGFLGSGKTTLLNRILSEEHGRKLAVIVNEIGQIGIDNRLVVNTNEEIVEMTNGCLCCSIREDLLVALKKLLQAKKEQKSEFEAIVIETTGLANPGPVIQTFFLDPVIEAAYQVNGVVTVVDGYHIEKHLDKGIEAQEQIAFADTIILNKTDLLSSEESKHIERLLQELNPTASIVSAVNCEVEISELLHINTFKVKEKLDIRTDSTNHIRSVKAFVLREERPLDFAKINEWMTAVVEVLGENLYRYKGILHVEGLEKRVVFQGVHTLFAATYDREWKAEEPRMSEVVFIGKDLNKEWFEEHFRMCIAQE
ncbi:GTP-binding protein [Bacillus sp. 165]|uniref:CobW family GTP-binding protein n=1 Tax=Bacillus sp. 165 TaxID=1529117 RepID=UPI001AD98FFA|nr:GTP-binding protein [Bacillus sp. 165]MBO9128162.1 GTP-binding protein [Bacillus sp. 165]